MTERERARARAIEVLAGLSRVGGAATNARWINARYAVDALTAAGIELVETNPRPEPDDEGPDIDLSGCPTEVLDLIGLYAPVEELRATANSVTIRTAGLELRFQRRIDDAWDFDEVVGECFVHIEQMSDSYYWIGLSTPQGRVCVDVGSATGRAAVRMTGWTEGP